jgi:hypothetical protein
MKKTKHDMKIHTLNTKSVGMCGRSIQILVCKIDGKINKVSHFIYLENVISELKKGKGK